MAINQLQYLNEYFPLLFMKVVKKTSIILNYICLSYFDSLTVSDSGLEKSFVWFRWLQLLVAGNCNRLWDYSFHRLELEFLQVLRLQQAWTAGDTPGRDCRGYKML